MFTLFVGIILLIYIYSVSKRVKSLEEKSAPRVPFAVPKQTNAVFATEPVKPTTVSAPAPVATPSAFDQNIQNISASQWFAGIGILALLFGLGFFLKYAIDQGWVSEWMRVIIGVLVGGLLVVLGEIWHDKYHKYARILSGGGLAVLYFSIFAAYQYYSLFEQATAAFVMILITSLGIWLSYRYKSKGLMIFALLGGYLSPLLLQSETNRQVALFVYLTILNASVLAIMVKRFWVELFLVTLIGTALVFIVWASNFSVSANTLNSVIFLLFNFIVLTVIPALLLRKAHEDKVVTPQTDGEYGALQVAAGFLFFIAITVLLYDSFRDYIAPVFLLGGVVVFLSYAILDRLEYRVINYCMSFAGSGLLVAAALHAFTGKVEDLYLIGLGLLGAGVGLKQSRKELRTWGLVILLITIIKTITHEHPQEFDFIFNAKFGLEMVGVIAALVAAWWFRITPVQEDEKMVPGLLKLVAAGIVWFAVSEEIFFYFQDSANASNLLLSLWWLGYAVVLGVLSAMRHNGLLRKASIVLFVVTILKVFLYDVQTLETGYRIISFIVLGAILLIVAFVYQKKKAQIQEFWKGDGEAVVTKI